MLNSKEVIKKEYLIIKMATAVVLVLCSILTLSGMYFANNEDLVRAFILSITSVAVVFVYQIGLRRFLRIINNNGGMNGR